MDFNSFTRVPKLDGNYFNYVQPYECHRKTPSDGINLYSFSLFPEENQISGSANLSCISRITMFMEFLRDNNCDSLDALVVRVYTRNINKK